MSTPIFLKGGFSLYMKPNSTRCLVCLLAICLLLSTVTPLTASATTDLPFHGKPWCHTMIFAEEEIVNPTTIVIYLHGDGNNGNTKEDLDRLANVDHPLKYARENTLNLPDDCVMVCFQSKSNGQFRNKSDELCEVIHALSETCPDAKIILAGHSHGAMAAYKIAAAGNTDIDGYVFISGMQPGESEKLPFIPNCLVVFGSENLRASRSDFSALFRETDITDDKYANESSYVEESTNNAYFLGPWTHGSAPQIFLEDFFWEWVSNVTVLDEESD